MKTLTILCKKQENYENLWLPQENHENTENLGIALEN